MGKYGFGAVTRTPTSNDQQQHPGASRNRYLSIEVQRQRRRLGGNSCDEFHIIQSNDNVQSASARHQIYFFSFASSSERVEPRQIKFYIFCSWIKLLFSRKSNKMKLCWHSSVLLPLLLLFFVFDGTRHAVDAKPKFLNLFRSSNYQPTDYQQPYVRSYQFGPQTGRWDGVDRQQPHQHHRHQAKTNGKERYNEICHVIHGIDHCHG